MSKEVSVKTASGRVLYKVSQSGSHFYCYKYKDSFFGSWYEIGRANSFEDAIQIIRSHAVAKYGSVYDVRIG